MAEGTRICRGCQGPVDRTPGSRGGLGLKCSRCIDAAWKRPCGWCGQPKFRKGKSLGRIPIFCSGWCASQATRKRTPVRVCSVCCRGFSGGRTDKVYCSVQCGRWWRDQDHERRRRELKPRAKFCVWCCDPISTGNAHRNYCSNGCSALAGGRLRATDRMCRLEYRHCRDCGGWFALANANQVRCRPCRLAIGNKRNESGKHRRFVLERDGWMCHLCGEGIPEDATYPDPLYGTADHVVTVLAGGSDDPDNLRAAHFRCNTVRGAKEIPCPSSAA